MFIVVISKQRGSGLRGVYFSGSKFEKITIWLEDRKFPRYTVEQISATIY